MLMYVMTNERWPDRSLHRPDEGYAAECGEPVELTPAEFEQVREAEAQYREAQALLKRKVNEHKAHKGHGPSFCSGHVFRREQLEFEARGTWDAVHNGRINW
jgi:hypothetical protein